MNIDFTALSNIDYNTLQAFKNDKFFKNFAQKGEEGEPIAKLMNFIDLVQLGVQSQAVINGDKRDIRTIKENAIIKGF